jgi:hypothetical protein
LKQLQPVDIENIAVPVFHVFEKARLYVRHFEKYFGKSLS